ncbi:methyltransferase family protein [Streptomyces mayonensis]|uniref:methyltransferase family protein n=1 Tax=Streptomyces mayonensis TaxID=2750816 RepID=UPI001C1E7374|nr:isoprenylcysteine carboxylmethyltransferase family protein [Streptomyces sp. A108]MBU6533019.1 isoprenylcysteine carboxylmethyltransferase family protein [Streptomyces sp. A108]
MDDSTLLFILLDYLLFILLPRVFFRKDGEFNLRWWSTALPMAAAPLFLVCARLFDIAPSVPGPWLRFTGPAAVLCAFGAAALVTLTIGSHRVPVALWHQRDDAPDHIVTWGAYRHIRHPFYSAFLLAFLGAFLLFPHWVTLALGAYMAAMLNTVAAREERMLSASEFGAVYREYHARTHRFVPLGPLGPTRSPARPAPPVPPTPHAPPTPPVPNDRSSSR